jgi:2',3'-cyclic-nucleotide 2'-phosphodiesterase (5'-nucleotidase family)
MRRPGRGSSAPLWINNMAVIIAASGCLMTTLVACREQGNGGERAAQAEMAVADAAPEAPPSSSVRAVSRAAPVPSDDLTPNLILVYSASSQGFLEPCGCAVRAKEMGGIARRATVVDSLRQTGVPLLLVEGGDFVGGAGEVGQRIGETTLRIMAQLGYDVIALGEAELRLGETFLKRLGQEGPRLAHANYSHPAIGPAQKDGLLIEKNGLRIGVIGLLDPQTLGADLPLDNLQVVDPTPAAAAAAQSLKSAGADLILVLGHGDYRQAGRLAQELQGADLWLVGHGGKELAQPQSLGETLLLAPGNAGKHVGLLELGLSREVPLQFAHSLYPLHLSIPEEPAISRIVKETMAGAHLPAPVSEQSPS